MSAEGHGHKHLQKGLGKLHKDNTPLNTRGKTEERKAISHLVADNGSRNERTKEKLGKTKKDSK